MPDLRRHAGRRDDELTGPSRRVGVHEDHVGPVAERDVLSADRVDALRDGQALARERGLGDLERRRLQQTAVGRDDVAGLDRDDVAGDQLFSVHLEQLAVAVHLGLDEHHLLQGGDGRGCLPLLVHPQDRVEDRQQEQHEAGAPLLDRQAADAGDEQHDLHRVVVLADERAPAGLGLALGELVRPILLEPGGGLGGRQAVRRIDLQRGRDLVSRQLVPGVPRRRFGGGGQLWHGATPFRPAPRPDRPRLHRAPAPRALASRPQAPCAPRRRPWGTAGRSWPACPRARPPPRRA